MKKIETITAPLKAGTDFLIKHRHPEPQAAAQFLLSAIMGISRTETTMVKSMSAIQAKNFKLNLKELALKRKPLAYVLGSADFMGIRLDTPAHKVLIPRPETELLVEEVIRQYAPMLPCSCAPVNINCSPVRLCSCAPVNKGIPLSNNSTVTQQHSNTPAARQVQRHILRILDIGTGSGNIAISLYKNLCDRFNLAITATDISDKALKVAGDNLKSASIPKNAVTFLKGSLFTPLPESARFDVIVSNPPYVSHKQYCDLQPEIRLWEPKEALIANKNGLEVIGDIIRQSPRYLRENGFIALEISATQGDEVRKMLVDHGYKRIEIKRDFNNYDRIATAIWTVKRR
ncbi:N5-glutamine methyltransferase family protein [Elusimicrobiota bacterium]